MFWWETVQNGAKGCICHLVAADATSCRGCPVMGSGYLVFKERWPGRGKSCPSTIRASVARFWGAKCVYSGIYSGKTIFADLYDVSRVTDGRVGRGMSGAILSSDEVGPMVDSMLPRSHNPFVTLLG